MDFKSKFVPSAHDTVVLPSPIPPLSAYAVYVGPYSTPFGRDPRPTEIHIESLQVGSGVFLDIWGRLSINSSIELNGTINLILARTLDYISQPSNYTCLTADIIQVNSGA